MNDWMNDWMNSFVFLNRSRFESSRKFAKNDFNCTIELEKKDEKKYFTMLINTGR